MERKTIVEWEHYFDTAIMDGDGFPPGTERAKTLFTKEEFLENVRTSTVKFSETLLKAMNG